MSKNNKSIVYVVSKTVKYAMKAAPVAMATAVGLAVVHGLLQASSVYFYQLFFGKVEAAIGGVATFSDVLVFIFLVCAIEVGIILFHGIYNFYNQDYLGKKLYGYIHERINLKAEKIDLINFEESILFDNVNKAVNSIESITSSCLNIVGIITYYLPFFFFVFLYFVSVQPKLAWLLLATFLPVIITNYVQAKLYMANEKEVANLRRKIDYYDSCITSRQFFKETRLLGAFTFFYELYQLTISMFNKSNLHVQWKVLSIIFVARLIRLAGYIGTFVLLFFSLTRAEITVAMFGAIFISLEKLNGITNELIASIGESYKQAAFGKFFYNFVDIPEREGKTEYLDKVADIRLVNVTFKYPKAERNSLDNINLTIRKGETIALVGENGAGKTTLSKLIMGLFEPTDGKVYIGDQDLSEYSYHSINDSVSSVFQNYQRYQMTLRENVGISDIAAQDEKRKAEVTKKAGLSIDNRDKFPEGMDTLLAREYNGIDLSGGEWQRIAIARGLYREHELIVLDEPTAAIDPLEENQIYNHFYQLAKDKTAVLVTHRLGSVRIADRILVLDNGKIVEDGKHEELLKNNGLYANMWKEQQKWYNR